ncbi:MAG: uncharacterized protein A8A55_1490 [Amphiamblys sp. WSBS2006]|nr:MAG: uncharacterized protein A8A55_1490 [Amphiamblys sp. WSBS2006]
MDSLAKKMSRLKEKTTQIFTSSKTEEPEEFQKKRKETDSVRECAARVCSALEMLVSLLSKGKTDGRGAIGDLGEGLKSQAVIRETRNRGIAGVAGNVQLECWKAQEAYIARIKKNVYFNVRNLHDVFSKYGKLLKTLEDRRLDCDIERKKDNSETGARVCKQRYEETLKEIEEVMCRAKEEEENLLPSWIDFLEAQEAYFRECSGIARKGLEEIKGIGAMLSEKEKNGER